MILLIGLLILIVLFLLAYYTYVKSSTDYADIIIVGGGTAGCVLAKRLNEKYPDKTILILERGKDRRNDPVVYNLKNAAVAGYQLPYSTTMPSGTPNVVVSLANMYGGGSSHNFGLAVRGSPNYYNTIWNDKLGVNYKGMQRYFRRLESYRGENSSLRYSDGAMQITPLPVKVGIKPFKAVMEIIHNGPQTLFQAADVFRNSGPLRADDRFSLTFANKLQKLRGVPIVRDYNSDVINCVSITPQLFTNSELGIRQSTNLNYLPLNSKNLQIAEEAEVVKVTDTQVHWNGKVTKLNPGGKIIMSAGAISTPLLLLRSGFSNLFLGQNMKTHYGFTLIVEYDASEIAEFSSGPVAFLPREGETGRAWQLVVTGSVNEKLIKKEKNKKYFSILIWDLKPQTKGTVTLGDGKGAVNCNLFGNEADNLSLLEAMRWGLQLVDELKREYNMKLMYPPERNNLMKYIQEGVSLTDHYCNTCEIDRVVDSDLRLVESQNIYVVDASVLPDIPDGNTAYPVIALAELMADRL